MYHVKTAEGFMQRSMMSEKMYLVVDGLRHVNKLSTKMCSGGRGDTKQIFRDNRQDTFMGERS